MASMDALVESKKMVKLISSEGEQFEIELEVAKQSPIIAQIIEHYHGEGPAIAPLANVPAAVLNKILHYCKMHAREYEPEEHGSRSEELNKWDAEFMKMDLLELFDVMEAANNMEITKLLDLTCQTVANMIKAKTPEEIRRIFQIKNNLTEEKEYDTGRENIWAFQDLKEDWVI
ncbi:hypothetical protein J5N97_029191 [Dioscorea zingiberensis]|uniref:SKP1-like protein n=1 Tax=Dioscorea zingiberensis TaxID=325984 RepID=A0A9D5H5E1_9LILI|nr:hypothetical protein J5N97_029191 [Dioscorea zingiberensis]